MNRYILYLLLSVVMTVFAQAQLFPDTVAGRLWQQTCLFPNEKIHLHTDRSLYMGGDTLWFRAYLVNALDNKPVCVCRIGQSVRECCESCENQTGYG